MWDWTKTKTKGAASKKSPRRGVRPANSPAMPMDNQTQTVPAGYSPPPPPPPSTNSMPQQHIHTQHSYAHYAQNYNTPQQGGYSPLPQQGYDNSQNMMPPQGYAPYPPNYNPNAGYPPPPPMPHPNGGHMPPPQPMPNYPQGVEQQGGYYGNAPQGQMLQGQANQGQFSHHQNQMPMRDNTPKVSYEALSQEAGSSDEETIWAWHFEQFDLPGMELHEVIYTSQTGRWKTEMRKAFKRARRDFLKFVGYHHVKECEAAGLDNYAIKRLRHGRTPENFNVHMKIPFDYAGTNDFSNLCLIRTHPYHEELHKFIDMQIALQPPGRRSRKLYIPMPMGKVYMPDGVVASSGGKDKHDRSVYAGFLECVFEEIRLKSALGR